MKRPKYHYIENILYACLAIIMFSMPLWINFGEEKQWDFIFKEWLKLTPFVLIFLINNFILAPKLLLKSRYTTYIISCLSLLLLMAGLNFFLEPYLRPERRDHREKKELYQHVESAPRSPDKTVPVHLDRREKPPLPPPRPFLHFSLLVIGLFILGFNSGVKIFIRWANDKERYLEKERHFLDTELNFLKHQISPHFFMNTLNNIHALIDIDSEKAKDSIIKLSNMMRYFLYETNTEKVAMSKELSFIESYIELMRLRYDEEKLSVKLSCSGDFSHTQIPSFLFLPMIENAFKHGIHSSKKSFIDIKIEEKEQLLTIKIKNSNYPKGKQPLDNSSGIGLENIKKRLELIYPNQHQLFIVEENDHFQITLTIPAV